jgi:lactoylglutathione lyase
MNAPVSLKLLVLKTHEVEQVRAFYRALGIEFVEEKHGQGPVHHAGQVGPVVLEIYPLPDDAGPADQTTRLGFEVNDLLGVLADLAALGADVAGSPKATERGTRAIVRDPDGRSVELYQRGA